MQIAAGGEAPSGARAMARPLYGGQAVLEGVMMRGHRHVAVAVRHPQGHIVTCAEALPARLRSGPIRKIPFARGALTMWDALTLGTRALAFSAQVAAKEDTPAGLPAASTVRRNVVGSLVAGIALFFVAPTIFVGPLYVQGVHAIAASIAEGLVRLALLIGYLWIIGKSPNIVRVFAYHGAEHKVVHAQEQGMDLEPDSVQKFTTAHPRCGTMLLLVVVVLSIMVFAVVGQPELWLRVLTRALLAPVLIGLAYEWLRFSATHVRQGLVQALVWPGLLLQSLTTREPDNDQVAVAIAALKAVMAADERVADVSLPAAQSA